MAMDHAHGTHAPHDGSTPTSRPESTKARGHGRSRSRDASTDSHHHTRDASLGSGGRRILASVGGGGGGGEETTNNSRGSSPARPHTTPSHSTPPTLLRHAHNLKKCSSSEVGGSGHGGGRRRSPLAARKSTPVSASPATGGGDVTGGSGSGSGSGGGGGVLVVGGSTPRHPNSTIHFEDPPVHSSTEECDGEVVPSSGVSNGSGELVDALRDGGDDGGGGGGGGEEHGATPHGQRAREAREHILAKIQKTRDLIKDEQNLRDENVNEYLKLAANADRQQMTRIKAVFEKKNQKSAALIQQLQKKLENYQRRMKEIDTHGLNVAHRQPKEVLRDMGQGLKTVISKPKEIAHLIKNKFGSADNIKELAGEEEEGGEERVHHGSATLPVGASLVPPPAPAPSSTTPAPLQSQHPASGGGAGGSSSGGHHGGGSKVGSEEGSECNSSITSESVPGGSATLAHLTSPRNHHPQMDFFGQSGGIGLEHILLELREGREEMAQIREEIETIKQTLNNEVKLNKDGLQEEKSRCERLEDQVNDLTELHQNEMSNLMMIMRDMEEKVQYQSEERIRDLQENVDDCAARIARMEHQQQQQQQQFLTLEGLETGNARAVFVKLINVLLTVLQVLLLVVATVANILTPLLQTRTRLVATVSLLLLTIFIYIQLPELRELWTSLTTRYEHFFSIK